MKIRPFTFLLLLLALPACTARQNAPVNTATPAALTVSAPTETQPSTPTATVPEPSPAARTATTVPSPTPTEISPLVLTLMAPTGTPASIKSAAEVPLDYQNIFRDTFDNNDKGWALSEGMAIEGGALRMWTGSRDINAVVVPLAERNQGDVSIRLDAQVVRWDGTSSLMFGAGCRMNDASYDQYMMFVGPLGKGKAMLQMAKFKSGQLKQLTDLPHIFNLPQDITQKPVPFEFICQGQNLVFKVGSQTVASLTDAEYTSGSIDLFVMGSDKQAAVAFEQVEISQVKENKK